MYVVKYSGPFGFIKPWTAVRDGETFSQQFLTPSIIKGIELKLFPELLIEIETNKNIQKILRHRLSYKSISSQQEQIQPKAYTYNRKTRIGVREKSILKRGIMINPVLHFAFEKLIDAETAAKQHICLCRNEDILLPNEKLLELSEEDFNNIDGFELIFGQSDNSFMVGFNRFENANKMYGRMEIQGNPVNSAAEE